MMQPILLSNQPTPKDSERFSELSASDKSLKVDDQLSSDVKSKDNFSGLLGSAIKSSDKSDVKKTALNSLIKPKSNTKTNSPEISPIKNTSTDTKVDPIMAQIETAQKANTTLATPEKLIQSSKGSLSGSVLLQKGIKTDTLMDNESTDKLNASSSVSNNLNEAVKPVNVLSDVIASKPEPSIKKGGLKSPEKDQVNISSTKINKTNIALEENQNTLVNSSSDIPPLDADVSDSDSVTDQESSPLQAVRHGMFSAKPSTAKNVKSGNLEQVEPIRRGLFTSQVSDNSAPAKLTTSQTDLLDVNDKLDHASDDADISQVLAAGFVSQPIDLEQVKSASNGISEQTVNSQAGAETIAGTNFPKLQSATEKSTQSLKLKTNTEIDGKAKLVSTMDTGQSIENIDLSTKLEKSSQKSNKFRDLLNQNSDPEKSMAIPTSVARVNDLNTFNLHKLENQNGPLNNDSSKLQQSIDLHSKHAANMLGERVLMMISQGKQEVQIRLDPAELGSMHLKLHMHQNQLQLSIQTDVGQSRDIIEQNMPKLREQLAQQGVNLGEANIEQRSQNQQQNGNQSGRSNVVNHQSATDHDNAMSINEGNVDWKRVKIPLPAQGIDYYA